MPQSGISVGSDYRFDIETAAGTLTLPTLLDFDKKPTEVMAKVTPLNGPPIPLTFPNGWEGSFSVARQDSTLDDYFAALEAAQYAGATIQGGYITETIQEVNGTPSQYMYPDVQLRFTDAGNAKATSDVIQKVSFVASARIKVL